MKQLFVGTIWRWDKKSHWGVEIQPAIFGCESENGGPGAHSVENLLNHGIFRGNWKGELRSVSDMANPLFFQCFSKCHDNGDIWRYDI